MDFLPEPYIILGRKENRIGFIYIVIPARIIHLKLASEKALSRCIPEFPPPTVPIYISVNEGNPLSVGFWSIRIVKEFYKKMKRTEIIRIIL
jgi:hypothetical protein